MGRGITRVSWVLLGLTLTLTAAAQAEWVALGSPETAAPEARAVVPGPERVVLRFDIPGFLTETVEIDGQVHTRVLMPGEPPLLEEGWPELPAISRSIVIPDAGSPEIRILDRKVREIPVPPVVPSKGSLPRTVDPATVPYVFGPLYRDGGVYPAQEAALTEPFILRDHRGVTVRVFPLRYDADRGVLLALESLTVEILTGGSGGVNPKTRIARAGVDGQFQHIYEEFFLNLGGAKYDPIPSPGPLLVVCYDAFLGPIAPFVEWKLQKGLPVEVLTTSEVGGTVTGIQNAIDLRYASPAGLTYVVLVGDIAQVPTHAGSYEGADSDPTYGMVEGNDLYPDLFVSRISAQTATQVQLQVAKFVRYERDPDLDGDWYHMGTGIASNEGSPSDIQRAEWLRADLLGYTFTHVDQIYQGQGGSTAAITAALNDGRSIINYIGHGTVNAWTSVFFGNNEVHALNNGWMHPWILDVSCSTGDFSLSESMAEAWLRAGSVSQPTGAIASYSASTLASWVPPCVMQAEAVDLLVAETENTLGALYFSGAMKTLDDYPPPGTEGRKLVEQYNIFGDCSLVVRTDTPGVMAAEHLPIFPLGSPTFAVEVPGIAGATVCLYREGTIHGTALTDAGGHADVVLDMPIVTVGDVTLTVTAYNMAPHIATLPAIVPANVTVVPDSIPVGVASPVTVTVLDTLMVGIEDVVVRITGYGVGDLADTTGAAGVANFTVDPAYGEDLQVRGRRLGDSYDLFEIVLPVSGALDLTAADISAEVPAIGLSGALTPFIEGTVTGSAVETDLTLYLSGCGIEVSGSDPGNTVVLEVTPDRTGSVAAALARAGYDLYAVQIPVVEAFGTLAGTVVQQSDGVTPISGARVAGYPAGADTSAAPPLFDLLSDGSGGFTVPGDLAVGYYDLYTAKFGFLADATGFFLMYGPNDLTVALVAAPSGVMAGTVTSADGGAPLQATVRVFRSDNEELYAQATSDPGDGSYTTAALPYFDYRVTVTAPQYIPETITVTIDAPSVEKHFVLDPTSGNILIVDDSLRPGGEHPAKLLKDGTLLAEGYLATGPRSGTDMRTELEALGYTVLLETVAGSNPASWPDYDLVIHTTGGNTAPLENTTFRNNLEAFVGAGGHLLIEGGEVGYRALSYPGYPTFAAGVLHCTGWNHDSSGSVTNADPAHYVMSVPNLITGPIAVSYTGYGDQDAMDVAADARMVGSWTTYPTDGSVVAFDPNPAPEGGQVVFFAFNYAAMNAAARPALLQNAVNWLITPEFGNCSVSGQVTLLGQTDHSGVLVETVPDVGSAVTGPSGAYALPGLFPGDYQLIVSKEGYATETLQVSLSDGQQLTDVDFQLAPAQTLEICSAPGLAIPDNDPAGVSDTIEVDLAFPISGVEVYLDVTHTFIGDLTVDLISPAGTTVRLHNNSGGSGDFILGWYPTELTPAQSLNALLGEDPTGTWELHLVDHGPWDIGTLNEWCLRIHYYGLVTGVEDGVPLVLDLAGNYPNPFNPRTRIVFSVPRTMEVDLTVFDVRGRRVAGLVHQTLEAGRHEVLWHGLDDAGRQVCSGLYVYRLRADNETFVRKMLLLK